jgi:CDP-2,3-bis-(O-geranylgeranyl)-sn-glycerol synthase
MLYVIIKAIFFFLPAYAANAAPVILARYHIWEKLNIPIDYGKKLKGNDLFGRSKTWRGLIGGILTAVIIAIIQFLLFIYGGSDFKNWYIFTGSLMQFIILGFFMGVGEGLGDTIKSFFKRRLGKKSGDAFFPFDQMSFLGALFLSFLIFIPPNEYILAIVIFSPAIPVFANLIAYKAGLKKVWW